MFKVRWVLSYCFYSKFHTLSSSAKILKILLRFDIVRDSLKVGRLFETQCSSKRLLMTLNLALMVVGEEAPRSKFGEICSFSLGSPWKMRFGKEAHTTAAQNFNT